MPILCLMLPLSLLDDQNLSGVLAPVLAMLRLNILVRGQREWLRLEEL